MARSLRVFTTTYDGVVRVLSNQCQVAEAFDPKTADHSAVVWEDAVAIWDTGATASVITERIVDVLGLAPTGMTKVRGVHGEKDVETFSVNLFLPNDTGVQSIRVTVGDLGDADLLIGMDIISRGDFTVTNHNGITQFSFRLPSQGQLDFLNEPDLRSRTKQKSGGQDRAARRRSAREDKKKAKRADK